VTPRWPQQIPCTDAHDRPGVSTIIVRDGKAVLTIPPGEAAKYGTAQLSELIDKLQAARAELYRRES
jgi:hypothetical protein